MENDELARAIEAVLFVAVEPVLPGLLAELLEEPVERIEEVLTGLADGYLAERPRLRPGPHRRRGPLADPPRPRALCRALRQPRRLAPAVDRRVGDAGHRGLPPAGVPWADLVVAGRERRRRDTAPRAAGLHRGGRPGRRTRATCALRHHRSLLGAPRTRCAGRNCRPSRTSCPGPRWPESSKPISRPHSACTVRRRHRRALSRVARGSPGSVLPDEKRQQFGVRAPLLVVERGEKLLFDLLPVALDRSGDPLAFIGEITPPDPAVIGVVRSLEERQLLERARPRP